MKKNGQITIHLPSEQAALFARMADKETDLDTRTASGFGRKIILDYLALKQSQFEDSKAIFEPPESESR